MRHLGCVAIFIVVEAALLGVAAGVEDGVHATEVFGLDELVDSADQFAKRTKLPSAGQSALQRVEAMKKALTAKLLNKEISKLPYTETELGEGMAVGALKAKGKIAKSYDAFKRLGKVLEGKNAALKKKMIKLQKGKTKAEKKELLARKAGAKLRKKIRKMVPKKAASKTKAVLKKLKGKIKKFQKKLKGKKVEMKKIKKKARKRLKKAIAKEKKKIIKGKKKLRKERAGDLGEIKKFKKRLEKQWYVNMKKVTTWKRKINAAKDKMKDLKGEVKNNDRVLKEREAGLKIAFLTKERDYMKKEHKKVKKQGKKIAGEKQKEAWDKLKVRRAKKEEKKENKVMAKGLKANRKLSKAEKKEEGKLKELKKKERREVKDGDGKIDKLKLKDDLEKLKQKQAETKISAVKTREKRRTKEVKKKVKKAIARTKAEADKKLRRMKRRVQKLQETFATRERVEKADQQAFKVKQKEEKNKMINKIKTEERETQFADQEVNEHANAEAQKVKKMKAKDQAMKQKLKRDRAREKKEQKFFKKKIAKDTARIEKRAGARSVAAAEQKKIKKEEAALAIKAAALKRVTKRQNALAKGKDKLQAAKDKYYRKLKHSQFRVHLLKKKTRNMKLKLKKMQLKYSMAKKNAKHEEELGEAKDDKSGEKAMEKKYKFQVKAGIADKQKVQLLQSKTTLGVAKAQKWQAKALKYKQAMYAALSHARKTASRVRKNWAVKLIKEQESHTKEIQRLKNLMGVRQAKADAKLVAVNSKADSAERNAAKSKNSAGNQKLMANYIAGLVAEQAVRGKVLRVYMNNMSKIRQKYNKKLGAEWEGEIKRLKKELRSYKNGRNMTRLKYKVMKLKHKLKQAKKKKMINLEIKRAQNLDIATLLHAAISRAQKGSKKRTGEQNRKRVVRAVNAVINTVMAGDRSQGAKLAAKAMKGADSAPDKKAAGSVKVSKLQDEIRRLRKKNAKLEKKVGAQASLATASKKSKVQKRKASGTGHMTKKQRALWRQLHSLVKMTGLPKDRIKITTNKKREYKPDPPKPPPSRKMAAAKKAKAQAEKEAPTPKMDLSEVGALRPGALLSPLRRAEEDDLEFDKRF